MCIVVASISPWAIGNEALGLAHDQLHVLVDVDPAARQVLFRDGVDQATWTVGGDGSSPEVFARDSMSPVATVWKSVSAPPEAIPTASAPSP